MSECDGCSVYFMLLVDRGAIIESNVIYFDFKVGSIDRTGESFRPETLLHILCKRTWVAIWFRITHNIGPRHRQTIWSRVPSDDNSG